LSHLPSPARSISLIDLLQRMAALPPDELRYMVWSCAEDSPPEVLNCLHEFGPFAGLVRLAPLFPRGYLDLPPKSSVQGGHRQELGQLLVALNRRIPLRRRAVRGSVWDARLDDVVFREINKRRRKHLRSDPAAQDLQELLFAVYDVAPPLARLQELISSMRREVDLSDAVLVAHQHILGTVVSMFEGLWELGLKPSRTYIAGKAYSTNRLAAMYLESKGCAVRSGLESFSTDAILNPTYYHQDNLDALGEFFADVVKKLPTEEISRLVVLDDGGLILSWLNRAFESPWLSERDAERLSRLKVIGVEQTTFGKNFLQHTVERKRRPFELAIPVASVASSGLKLHKESKFIAESVVHELDAWVRANEGEEANIKTLDEATVGVVGYGVVGSHVCQMLRSFGVDKIVVFDEDFSHSSVAGTHGYRSVATLKKLVGECSVIIGCTGARAGVDLEAPMLKPGTILASASSGNYEFAQVFTSGKLGSKGIGQMHPELNPMVTPGRRPDAFDWVHSIFSLCADQGTTYVLNGGFPVNFTGAIDPIRADQIELTRCLMVQGVASAYRQSGERGNFGQAVELAEIDERPINDVFGF
jgi:S-adenosylhomocysteine hydrolase